MNEFDLLRNLMSLEQKFERLEIKVACDDKSGNVPYLKNELESLTKRIDEVKEQLINFPNKSSSAKTMEIMLAQLSAYVVEIGKVEPGLKLIRNQSTALDNYLLSGILHDLRFLITNEVQIYRIPMDLKYTYSDSGSIETKKLSDFLKNELEILRGMCDPNFIKLRDFYNNVSHGLLEAFLEK